jgi:hypothetical protein
LIALWAELRRVVLASDYEWVESLRGNNDQQDDFLPRNDQTPFVGSRTMLNQEQGVRGVLAVANELFFLLARSDRAAFDWSVDLSVGVSTTVEDVSDALASLGGQAFAPWIAEVCASFASFDWRSADAPGLSEEQRLTRRAYRGSGRYVSLREQLMRHVAAQVGDLGAVAAAWTASQARN